MFCMPFPCLPHPPCPPLSFVFQDRLTGLESITDDYHQDGKRNNPTIQQEIDAIFLLLLALVAGTVWMVYRRRRHSGKAFGGKGGNASYALQESHKTV